MLGLAVSCGTKGNHKPDNTPAPDTSSIDASTSSDTTATVETLEDNTFVCRPEGTGPFPAVLYNHGGLAMVVGGNLLDTCKALANAGYLARSEQRAVTESPSIAGHLDEVLNALTELRSHPDTDNNRIGIMGYSRGGLLSLHAAIQRPNDVQAILLMAPAPGGGSTSMDGALANVSPITAPVRLLVAENDGPPAQTADHVEICQEIQTILETAEKTVELIMYPPFADDGHELFFEVDDIYWPDVLGFLATQLKNDP